MHASKRWQFVVLGLFVAASGCGHSERAGVSGRVTYKGEPVPSTLVTFQPEERGKRASHGVTDDNGNFTLTFSRTETGVLYGRHTVFLSYVVSGPEESGDIQPKASKELKAIIAKYGDPKTSGLHYEITTGGQFIEIPLE